MKVKEFARLFDGRLTVLVIEKDSTSRAYEYGSQPKGVENMKVSRVFARSKDDAAVTVFRR